MIDGPGEGVLAAASTQRSFCEPRPPRLFAHCPIRTPEGVKAGVKVNADTGKCASAHDFRRAFGQRWPARVMPQILMQLMRHEDISTTMKYYVGKEVDATADVLWAAIEKKPEQGNTLGNTRRKRVKN